MSRSGLGTGMMFLVTTRWVQVGAPHCQMLIIETPDFWDQPSKHSVYCLVKRLRFETLAKGVTERHCCCTMWTSSPSLCEGCLNMEKFTALQCLQLRP